MASFTCIAAPTCVPDKPVSADIRNETAASQALRLIVLCAIWTATWALAHGYGGLRHDTTLYTLQALAHEYPGDLSNDVFLRFGSQDQYTLFGSLYALVIGPLGVEPAAAVLTFTSQLALILGAALLLNRVAPTRALMALGVSVLIAIPGFYGADRIFSCIEPFLTPRMGAEALVLAGLSAAWSERPKLAWGLVATGMLIHPVMAAAGLTALGWFYFGIRRPGPTLLLLGGGLLLLWGGAGILPNGRWGSFDPEWLAIVRARVPYVFLAHESLDDWGRAAVPLATLVIGAIVLVEHRARLLSQVALGTALTGLMLSLVACDLAKLVLFTQLQPWRWQWLGVVTAALLLPAIAAAAWRRSDAGRIAMALLAAAWLFGSDESALLTAAAAVAALALDRYAAHPGAHPRVRLLVYGAVGLVLIALVNRTAANLLFLEVHYADPQIPLWIREMSNLTSDGSLPVVLGLLATWLIGRRRGTAALAFLGVLAAATCVALFPDVWRRWTQQRFPTPLVAQFAPWRALIPGGAAVFWSEAPLETWVLLQRPSYISVAQASGVLFSRASALEIQQRAQTLSSVVPTSAYLDFSGNGAGTGPSAEQLERACATSAFEFLVTGARLSWQPVAQLPAAVWHSSGGLRLYRCAGRTD
jgi:hypothetical protein